MVVDCCSCGRVGWYSTASVEIVLKFDYFLTTAHFASSYRSFFTSETNIISSRRLLLLYVLLLDSSKACSSAKSSTITLLGRTAQFRKISIESRHLEYRVSCSKRGRILVDDVDLTIVRLVCDVTVVNATFVKVSTQYRKHLSIKFRTFTRRLHRGNRRSQFD